MSLGYFPIAQYRQTTVTNGGTTIVAISSTRTFNNTDTTNKDLTETQLADIGGQISFVLTNTNKTPIPLPPVYPTNPHTT